MRHHGGVVVVVASVGAVETCGARGSAPMPGNWRGDDGVWRGPERGSKGDREAQTQRQVEKRRLAREVARAAAGKPKSKGGRTQWPQKGRCSKSTSGLPRKRPQCQKASWMRRRLRGKQAPMGVTAFARAAHAKVTHAKAVMAESVTSERAAVAVAQTAGQGAAVALERAMEAETRAAESVKTSDDVAAEAVRYAVSQWKQLGGQGPPFLAVYT